MMKSHLVEMLNKATIIIIMIIIIIIIIIIIELGHRKISWFVSVSQTNYLPQPSASAYNWSACLWKITIFCSSLSNNC